MKKSTTYFVSSLNGNDENDGLSESTAFKSLNKINEIELAPGDKVFLLKGSVFENEFLHLKNCGDINADMIEITSYGDNGDLPIINTNGKGVWYQDYGNELDFGGHVYKGNVSSAILLYDVENILIKDIEITNNLYLNAIDNFYSKNTSRTIVIDEIPDDLPIYLGSDLRTFNKKIIENKLEEFYVNFLNEMQIGFDKIIINEKYKEKITNIVKFLSIYGSVEIVFKK